MGVVAPHDDLHPGGKLYIVADMEPVDMPERLPAGFRAAAKRIAMEVAHRHLFEGAIPGARVVAVLPLEADIGVGHRQVQVFDLRPVLAGVHVGTPLLNGSDWLRSRERS